jgi:beta-glucosidase
MAASKNAIAQDTYFQNMMKYNIKFWLYNLAKSNSMNGIDKNTKIERVLTWWQSLIYAFIVIFAVLTLLFIFLMIRADNKAKLSVEYEDKKEKKKE